MMKNLRNSATAFVVMLVVAMFVTGCKDKDPTRGIVKITKDGVPTSGAKVIVSCTEGNCTVVKNGNEKKVEGTTDSEGKVVFTFDLPAVLKVTATYSETEVIDSITTVTVDYYGEGFIKLEEHEDAEANVKIYK